MSANQFVVIWRPDDTQVVRVVGPFRSEAKAIRTVERIEKIEGQIELTHGISPFYPEVIWLESLPETLASLRERFSDV